MHRTEYSIMLRIPGLKINYNFLNAAKYGQTTWFYIFKPKGSETSSYISLFFSKNSQFELYNKQRKKAQMLCFEWPQD